MTLLFTQTIITKCEIHGIFLSHSKEIARPSLEDMGMRTHVEGVTYVRNLMVCEGAWEYRDGPAPKMNLTRKFKAYIIDACKGIFIFISCILPA